MEASRRPGHNEGKLKKNCAHPIFEVVIYVQPYFFMLLFISVPHKRPCEYKIVIIITKLYKCSEPAGISLAFDVDVNVTFGLFGIYIILKLMSFQILGLLVFDHISSLDLYFLMPDGWYLDRLLL